MNKPLNVGVMGCGNISAAYMRLSPLFNFISIKACADLNTQAAEKRAKEFDLKALSVDELLGDEEINIIVNLTIPAAHFAVSKQALEAGKHVYSEKPFVLSLNEGLELQSIAEKKNLRIGSAPDTFLGGSHQLARMVIDQGLIGNVTSGTCFVQSPGMEMWHPSPDFFFKPGAGPVLDIGPYYISNLVQLLGPVQRVVATSGTPQEERTITSKPRFGEKIKVETPTTLHALLEFHSGAKIMLGASWDVWQHNHAPMELYGEQGTLHVPDPNFFGGELRITKKRQFVNSLPGWDHPFSQNNQGDQANYRAAGLADMASSIMDSRPHRCSLEFALHVIDVMTSILQSAEQRRFIDLQTVCQRPEPLNPAQASALLV